MALADGKNDPTDRIGEPSGKGKCPPTAGLASRDGCQGQAGARERAYTGTKAPDPTTATTEPATVRRVRTWRHYTTGSEPVKPVAGFSGFRGRARPDRHYFLTIDFSELKPQ